MSQGVMNLLNNLLKIFIVFACVFSRVQCNKNGGQEYTSDSDLLRNARLFDFLGEPKPHFSHTRSRPPGPNVFPLHRLNARSDGPAPNQFPPKFALRSPQPPAGLHHMGIEQNANYPFIENNPQHRGYHYDNSKPVRFAHFKDAVLDVGKNQFVRPEGILQYPSEQYLQNFKTAPRFNGNVNLLQKNPNPSYTPFPQHEIPVQPNQYMHHPKPYVQPENYGPVQSKQAVMKKAQFPQEHSSYAVHEELDNLPKQGIPQQQGNFRQPVAPQIESKEAQDYLHFMGTNEYFLPKRDPDYKKLDAEHDGVPSPIQHSQQYPQSQLQQYQQQQQSQQQLQSHQQPQQQPQQQHQQHQQQQHHYPINGGAQHQATDNSLSSSYNEPIQVADLFYNQDPAPPNVAVVRGSYQAGQDVFVVKSDGNKAVKHVVLTPMTAQTTTPAPPSTARNQNLQKSHKGFTQEPVRFEFTEQDAIRGHISYTQSPQGNKYKYETIYSTPHQTNPVQAPAPIAEIAKPIKEYSDDIEDSADTEHSKQQQIENTQIQAAGAANSQDDTKATESYCENICANVYDENDEIVCGSDGYMYTGETQLECYSSCLNISITIKSKGSCT
ncbi:putative mediator of RNA polymerase II transcription subunit 26 [Drosophila subobscura]|uniref:putative mediator of RNA polymerase II transcription subunit 26 n=1 Tax=Drosophila subobscura TaxID=7241 RepID=UPI00155A505E|nr:putative mediator of RNA polymerase II transcription subunit 26 [Drosophila subobscura]